MTLYKVCDLILESNVPLPGLVHAEGKEPECTFQLLPAQGPGPVACHWFHHWRLPDGALWLSIAKQESGYLLRFPDLADFLVFADRRDIRCYPGPGIPMETIRHLFLDQVIPLALSQRGRVVLHASAVATSEGAIAFLGETGRGKSTLTASFVQQGFPLLTDDCFLLEEAGGQLFGIPSYPGVRLWPDVISALFEREPVLSQVAHYTAKKRWGIDSSRLPFCADSVPLRRAYVLAHPQEMAETSAISIVSLSLQDALMELVKHAYRLDITDRQRLGEEFECIGRVATLLRISRLAFPRDLSLLPTIREAILEDLSQP